MHIWKDESSFNMFSTSGWVHVLYPGECYRPELDSRVLRHWGHFTGMAWVHLSYSQWSPFSFMMKHFDPEMQQSLRGWQSLRPQGTTSHWMSWWVWKWCMSDPSQSPDISQGCTPTQGLASVLIKTPHKGIDVNFEKEEKAKSGLLRAVFVRFVFSKKETTYREC